MPQTITRALIDALAVRGIGHVFGIPGDYALGLFHELEQSRLALINTCDEQTAGFAADAYARVRGLGAVAVTYGVGGLKLVNSTAQAYAERSPVVVISGAPGIGETTGDALLHHRVRDFGTQMRVFREVTVAQAVLDDPTTAMNEIERVLDAAATACRPVYFELPRDCAALELAGDAPVARPPKAGGADPETLREAIDEAVDMLNAADNPIILAGVEVHRFGLQDALVRFIGKSGIRFATTIMGKSVVNEELPGFVGVYAGVLSNEAARAAVESSDCVLNLGAMLTDLDTGIFTADLDPARMIMASADVLGIRRHQFPGIGLKTFMEALGRSKLRSRPPLPPSYHASHTFEAATGAAITVARVFECLDARLSEDVAVVADPGDALFGAIDLTIHSRTEFIACAYYASLGFAVPAAIALQLAEPQWRPLVLVGDGAFQMTGMEISTALRYGLSPIVIVLDNAGFGTERPMLDGAFNDVHRWAIAELPAVIGGGRGFEAHTEDEFSEALEYALGNRDELVLIHVYLDVEDISPALRRLTSQLGKRV